MQLRITPLILFFVGCFTMAVSQKTNQIELNPEKVKQFSPYMATKHGGPQGLEEFRIKDKYTYLREMWYFTESFYVKPNHLAQGISMTASFIDITRFEHYRKADEEAVVELPGFKDALVLLPLNKLIYKPTYN